jgi:hypothetical protein
MPMTYSATLIPVLVTQRSRQICAVNTTLKSMRDENSAAKNESGWCQI